MLKNSSKLIFFISMILGTFISISANSWLGVWMGLEINLLSIIPLMIDINNLMSNEAALKYFLIQAFASSMMLFFMVIFMLKLNMNFQLNSKNSMFLNLSIFITFLIKCGAAPFHFWLPNVMEGMSWNMNLILMTWQKLTPLLMISYFSFFHFFLLFIILSAFMGAIKGLNQTSLRKIMAFSSINHLSWMLTAMMFNEYLWILYFLIYSFLSFCIIFLFNMFKMFYLNQMFSMFVHSYLMKFILMISFLSLSGLPPFLGFLPKWMVIQNMMNNNQILLMMLLVMMSLITMYFYMRICYSAFMLNYSEMINTSNKFFYSKSKLMIMLILKLFSMIGLFIFISMMYYFY